MNKGIVRHCNLALEGKHSHQAMKLISVFHKL